MPIIKSAIKRVKISELQRQRNSSYKSKVKTMIKKYENSLVNGSIEDVNLLYQQCISVLDKSAQKGIMAKNTVSRKKSLLSKKLHLFTQSKQNEPTPVEEKK